MKQIFDRHLQHPGHLAEPANLGKANGKRESGLTSHEYFNLPAVDIRITARCCYFDIELPGVIDKASINIHWISSQSFVVEGEIPRPRISIRDELDHDLTIQDWMNSTGEAIDPPNSLVSLSGSPTRKYTRTVVNESEAPNGETTPKPKDNQQVPKSSTHRTPPMDEIALMHSRSNSSKISSHHHKPHNDHDIQPDPHAFSFFSNHSERQSPQHIARDNLAAVAPAASVAVIGNKARSNSTTSNDILLPIQNGYEPQLLLAERLIGTYKRRYTVPGDGDVEVHVERTEARLEAGVLTVRVPRLMEKERREETLDSSSGWKVVVE